MSFLVAKLKSNARVVGSILLISGTTIGGGMLALPLSTAPMGFLPSLSLLTITWLVMTFTAFLLLECTLATGENTNLISMSRKTLGPVCEGLSWLSYLLLLYALISAYISGASSLLGAALTTYTSQHISSALTASILTTITIVLVIYGIRVIDNLNRILVLGGVVCYFLLMVMMSSHVRPSYLSESNLFYMPLPLPVLVTAFGFHIVIPSLVRYLNRDVKLLRFSLFVGSFIPLIVYLGWQVALIGSLPLRGENGTLSVLLSNDQLSQLNKAIMSITRSSTIYSLSASFSTFAILTSLLGVALSLWDFLADGFTSHRWTKNKTTLTLFAFGPPIWLVIFFPQAFTALLGYAGIFVSILLGILPIAMCWKGRKNSNWALEYRVSCGKLPMVLCVIFFILVIAIQFAQDSLGKAIFSTFDK